MVKKVLYFMFVFLLGAITCFSLLAVWKIYSLFGSQSWNHVNLAMNNPNCEMVLQVRSKSFLPPTEHERSITIIYKNKIINRKLPDDQGGRRHIGVFIIQARSSENDTLHLILLTINDGFVVIDPVKNRFSELQLTPINLNNKKNMKLVQGIVSDDWEQILSFKDWRYIASFDLLKNGWGIASYEYYSNAEKVTISEK